MFKIVLRKKITFLFLWFGLLPLVVTFFLTVIQIQKSLRETENENLISLADEIVGSVEKTVQSVYIDVELLSANPIIRSKQASNKEKLSEIKRIQDFYGIFEDITLIDLNGNVIVSSTYKYRGDWKNKLWYQDAKEGKSSISPAYIILGPYKVILSSTAPVRDEQGKIIAVIAGQVNMEKIWETTNDIKIGGKGFVFLTGDVGAVQSAVKAALEATSQEDLIKLSENLKISVTVLREQLKAQKEGLEQAILELGLVNASAVHARVENYRPEEPFDTVISRAFAATADFVALAGHLVSAGGRMFAMKGRDPGDELKALPEPWVVVDVHQIRVPGLSAERHLVELRRN